MVENQNRVPKKQWRKWSEQARYVFNEVYAVMYFNPSIVKHPRQPEMEAAHWKTLAWNSAWIAADAVDEAIPETCIDNKTGEEVLIRKVAHA